MSTYIDALWICPVPEFFLSDENTFFELDGSDGHGRSARPAVQQPPNKQLRLLQFGSMQRTNAGCCMSTAQGSSAFFSSLMLHLSLFLFFYFPFSLIAFNKCFVTKFWKAKQMIAKIFIVDNK